MSPGAPQLHPFACCSHVILREALWRLTLQSTLPRRDLRTKRPLRAATNTPIPSARPVLRSALSDGPESREDLNKPSSSPVYLRGSDNRGGGVDYVPSCPPRHGSGGRTDLRRYAGDGVWVVHHGTKCGTTRSVHHHVDRRSDGDVSWRCRAVDCRCHRILDISAERLGEHEVGTGIDRHRPVAGVPRDVSPTHHSLSADDVSAPGHIRSRRPDDHSPPIGHSDLIEHEFELRRHPHR